MVGVSNTLVRRVCMHTVFNTADQVLGSRTIFGAVALNAGGYTVRVMGILRILAGSKGAGMFTGLDASMLMEIISISATVDFSLAKLTGFDADGSMVIGFTGSTTGTGFDTSGMVGANTITIGTVMTELGAINAVHNKICFRAFFSRHGITGGSFGKIIMDFSA